jgi:hypothetical protein
MNEEQIIIFEQIGMGWSVDDGVFRQITTHNFKETLLAETSLGDILKKTGNTNRN